MTGQDVPGSHVLATPFHLEAGHVLLLGRFDARVDIERHVGGNTTVFSIKPRALPADDAAQLFTAAYPGFARAPLECLLCSAPAAGATAAAAPPRLVERPSDTSPQRTFRVAEGHEVWINDGDPKVYLSKAEAVAAQAR